ncbi:HD domain-containing phosphohydrolase [Humisphaera borealis]|uniref:HD domain-containing protein n=1 Tax=Humisphaera borealis TaxID=2807512 RepID=A0A7M2WXI5_9BACT|nr:HD domain-containing phosphohydrolase [Humisphaera borealis]QOV90237.1 HD domain-containing protein [Humisphaera borealis]
MALKTTPNLATLSSAKTGGPVSLMHDGSFDALAERFRSGGLLIALVQVSGAVVEFDARSAQFFQHYALPALRQPHLLGNRALPVAILAGTDAVLAPAALGLRQIPGIHLVAIPLAEKKTVTGVLIVAARADAFSLTEDVLRVCGKLGVDSEGLPALADELPGYSMNALNVQAGLIAAAIKDQSRISGLERELDSLSQHLSDTYEELGLIYQLSSGMKVNRRTGDFFKQACLDVMQVMNVRGMGVALDLPMQDCPEPAVYGRLALSPAEVDRISSELLVVLRRRKCPLMIDRLAIDPVFGWLSVHARQLIAVPVQRQDQVLGVLFALDKEDDDFGSVDTKLLTSIANESGIYLENATLFDDVHGLMMGLLHALTSAVDAKDAYTCGHSERVALLSRYLAQQMKLRDTEVEQIYMAGLLHDVGKIGVPEAVLQKPGRLTPEEFEQIKKHPEIGARILSDVKQLKPILPGVLHHHERYDGKGYPYGLAGEKIPIMGRIICMSDCFDAMTSSRTYRKALPIEVAMCEIRRCSGTQFDPFLAEAFLRTTPDALRELLRDHKERSKQLIDKQEPAKSRVAA